MTSLSDAKNNEKRSGSSDEPCTTPVSGDIRLSVVSVLIVKYAKLRDDMSDATNNEKKSGPSDKSCRTPMYPTTVDCTELDLTKLIHWCRYNLIQLRAELSTPIVSYSYWRRTKYRFKVTRIVTFLTSAAPKRSLDILSSAISVNGIDSKPIVVDTSWPRHEELDKRATATPALCHRVKV